MNLDPSQQRAIEIFVEIVGSLILGGIILLFGRRLFWLLGGIGLALISLAVVVLIATGIAFVQNGGLQGNVELNENMLQETPALALALIVATVGGGLVGALLLIRLPRVAAGIVGFILGAYLLFLVFELYDLNWPEWLEGILSVIAGAIVAWGAWRNHDTALIVSSTLLGANLVVTGLKFDLTTPASAIVWLILMLTGIISQTYGLNRSRVKAKRKALAAASVPQIQPK